MKCFKGHGESPQRAARAAAPAEASREAPVLLGQAAAGILLLTPRGVHKAFPIQVPMYEFSISNASLKSKQPRLHSLSVMNQ